MVGASMPFRHKYRPARQFAISFRQRGLVACLSNATRGTALVRIIGTTGSGGAVVLRSYRMKRLDREIPQRAEPSSATRDQNRHQAAGGIHAGELCGIGG